MTDYFQYFVDREFPEGANYEQRKAVNEGVGCIEKLMVAALPQTLDCPEELQNNLFKAAYEILRYRRMN